MINTILSDFSKVVLLSKNKNYKGSLNKLYKKLLASNKPFDFFDHFEVDEELLNFYYSLKKRYSLNIFTAGTIQKLKEVRVKIAPIFDNIFSATDLSLNKKESNAYLFIAKKLNKNPNEIIYIDDNINNINAAKKAGMEIYHYEDFIKLKNYLTKILYK
jgi:HAD superfamily hydrolase (TIGR01549 family)